MTMFAAVVSSIALYLAIGVVIAKLSVLACWRRADKVCNEPHECKDSVYQQLMARVFLWPLVCTVRFVMDFIDPDSCDPELVAEAMREWEKKIKDLEEELL